MARTMLGTWDNSVHFFQNPSNPAFTLAQHNYSFSTHTTLIVVPIMLVMPLSFTPNTAFSDHIKAIQASDYDQGLNEIHEKLKEQFPGADISFTDVCRELLEQSRSCPDRYVVRSHAFADQFSQIFEQERLLDESIFPAFPGVQVEEKSRFDLTTAFDDTLLIGITVVHVDPMKRSTNTSTSSLDQALEYIVLRDISGMGLSDCDKDDQTKKNPTAPSDCVAYVSWDDAAEQAIPSAVNHEQVAGGGNHRRRRRPA